VIQVSSYPFPEYGPDLVSQFDDPLLSELRDTRWRRWRFRNRPDYFKIARAEKELGLTPTTHPDQWEL